MERFSDDERMEQFRAFREVIKQRVHDIAVTSGSTIRRAQAVERRLFDAFNGEASKVTDDDISTAFDAIDKE